MKRKISFFFITLLILCSILYIFFIFFSKTNANKDHPEANKLNAVHSQPHSAALNPDSQSPCLEYHDSKYSLNSMLNSEANSFRYQNIHKRINGHIFRLRKFKKEGENTEFDQFLVYKEDQNEEEHLIEKSTDHPGKVYQKILNSLGEELYNEIGIEDKDEILYQYISNKLVKIDGQTEEEDIHCTLSN